MANENKIKHLEFIQNVITRMVTLVAALFALAAKDSNVNFAIIAYIVIPTFWLLDDFFIIREKHFRNLYDIVRLKNEEDIDYSMIPKTLNIGDWITDGVVTYTLVPFYGIMLIATFAVLIIFNKNSDYESNNIFRHTIHSKRIGKFFIFL